MNYQREENEFCEEWKGGFYCRDTKEIFIVRRRDNVLFIGDLKTHESGGNQ